MSDAKAAPGFAITADLLGADFFTLLGLPKRFELDTVALDARFRELQREVHPDRFAAADDAARRASMMLATQINAAYQTLRSPLKRASYLLEQAGVPCGPINNLAQVFEDAQVKARGLRLDMPHALGCLAPQVASPIRLSATPVEYRNAPPLLGQHTEQVLRSLLGMSDEQISALRSAGVL